MVDADLSQPGDGIILFFRPQLHMKILYLIRHHSDKISNRLAGELTAQSANTDDRAREKVVEPENAKSIMVLFM